MSSQRAVHRMIVHVVRRAARDGIDLLFELVIHYAKAADLFSLGLLLAMLAGEFLIDIAHGDQIV